MGHINIEIKAKSKNPGRVREFLKSINAEYKGVDHQVDTYFKVHSGRLKLREGNIENYLIHYQRENRKGPKQSKVTLFKSSDSSLKDILTKSLGVLVVVDKKREIYFVDNVKFHIDEVKNLGSFLEIEAIDMDGSMGEEKLLKQCRKYMQSFGVKKTDLIATSYSDLLLNC